MQRRDFVAAATAAAATGIPGCLGGDGGGGANGGGGFADHPSTTGIADEPTLGAADASAHVVAFEDPSCPACRRFETRTFPEMRDPIERGDLAFTFRGYPVVYPWGRPAAHALEAVYSRDEDAFWALKDHYYRDQASFQRAWSGSADDVYGPTERWLADNAEVDAAATVAAARGGDHASAVQSDLDAGRSAGVRGTPTFYLFADGDYVTSVNGPQGYGVFANALGL